MLNAAALAAAEEEPDRPPLAEGSPEAEHVVAKRALSAPRRRSEDGCPAPVLFV
jgi:hypothetical protein